MKKAKLKSKQPLRAKKPMRRVSDKQKKELALRAKLKHELIAEFGEHCMTCGDLYRDWRGITLSHKIPLSRGGKTTRENCLLECGYCHDKYEKHPERRQTNE